MTTRTTLALVLSLLLALSGCAGRVPPPEPDAVPPDLPEAFDPGCGALADPRADLFDASCDPGTLARYDGADGSAYVYRCDGQVRAAGLAHVPEAAAVIDLAKLLASDPSDEETRAALAAMCASGLDLWRLRGSGANA